MIQPLESWFGTYSWPGTEETRRNKQVSVPVGSYGIVLALPNWEEIKFNKVTDEEREVLRRAALEAYMFFYTLGHAHTDEDLPLLKAQTPMRVYSARLDAEVVLS